MASATSTTAAGSSTIKALVLHGAKDLRLESRSVPPPTGSEVQVAVRATGLCGSDLHYYSHGRNGDFVVREPMCLGHESAGVVTAVGPDAKRLKVGDQVALEVGIACRKCSFCVSGRYNLCPKMKFRSSAKIFPHLDGTLMEITNHPEELCHPLPQGVSFAGGALAEPLAVCLHAVRRSHPPTKEEVEQTASVGEKTAALVFGAGAIGLLLVTALGTSQHFQSIVIADIDAARLEVAKSLNIPGLETYLIPRNPPPAADADPTTHALTSAQNLSSTLLSTFSIPQGFARVYDCTGVPSCVQTGIYASAPGGVLTLVGMGSPIQTLPLGAAALREVDIVGVFRYDGYAYPAALQLISSDEFQRLGVEQKVVTHRVPLTAEGGGDRAFGLAGKGADEEGKPVVKVMIVS